MVSSGRLLGEQTLEDTPNHRRQVGEHGACIHRRQRKVGVPPFDGRVRRKRKNAGQMPEKDHAERIEIASTVTLRGNRSQLLRCTIDDLIDHSERPCRARCRHGPQTDAAMVIDGKVDGMQGSKRGAIGMGH